MPDVRPVRCDCSTHYVVVYEAEVSTLSSLLKVEWAGHGG